MEPARTSETMVILPQHYTVSQTRRHRLETEIVIFGKMIIKIFGPSVPVSIAGTGDVQSA